MCESLPPRKSYAVDGKTITVIRRFTGDKSVSQAVMEIAVSRASRETGLN
ncbi:MAG: hypothetical protein K2L72_01030 [Clostridia bacterium]|nr:hypothetical protein [Clostridia bacterium]